MVGPENVAEVERMLIETGPRISGSLEAAEQAVIRAESDGSVQEVTVDVGQYVQKNQLLARIDTQALTDALMSARAALQSAKQSYEVAQREVERSQRLVKAGAVASYDLELATAQAAAAKAQVAEANARVAQAQKKLQDAQARSPIAGAVSRKLVNAGDIVTSGSHLFTIIDPSTMRLHATVPSESLGMLATGTAVRFRVRGYPDRRFEGRIERIVPAADPTTRQIPIVVAIPNPGGKLVANLFAEGRVQAHSKEALAVPLSAISDTEGETTARVVRDGKVEVVPVQVGVKDEMAERAEVVQGLKAGDLVLTGAARELAAGTLVEAQSPSEARANNASER